MSQIETPQEFFGFAPGSDFHMIRWDRLCEYYRLLDSRSDRILVREVGKSSEGNPFLMIWVSSAENLRNLEYYRSVSLKMADPRELTEQEIDRLAQSGKAVCMQTYGLHSNEVGGPQAVPELLYRLVTAESGKLKKILDNVIFIVAPCCEPDGEIIFTDWYEKYLGTPFEGCCSPYLRHNWAGHSNARDAVRESVAESRYINDVLIRDWKPQAVQDHHHQYPYENRMSIAPMSDPIYEPMSPLVLREQHVYGAVMAQALSDAGRRGIVSGEERYPFSPITTLYSNALLHNSCGMLTESADAYIATPAYVHREQIRGTREACTKCPDPWEGGEWHLSDIVDQMQIASLALLECMAQDPAGILRRMAQKALEQSARGRNSAEKAYLIQPHQHDPSVLDLFLKLLKKQCIDFYAADCSFVANGRAYPKGTVVVPLDQPNYAAAVSMLAIEPYPTGSYNLNSDGSVNIFHGDKANVCTALCMGIAAEPAMESIDPEILTNYRFAPCPDAFPLSARENISYRTVNRMLAEGKGIWRRADGDFLDVPDGKSLPICRARVGLFKNSKTGNAHHGFANNLLCRYAFDYRIVMDTELRTGEVLGDIDVLILPGDTPEELSSGDFIPKGFPPEYRSGLGAKGAEALRKFVERGGRLLVFEASCLYVNELFELGLQNASEGLSPAAYMTAGSALRAHGSGDPLLYGMPSSFTLTHCDSPVLLPTDYTGKICTVARYADKDHVYVNGCMRGEEVIANTPAVMRARVGAGEILLYSFMPHYLLQQDSTFKLIFNACYR